MTKTGNEPHFHAPDTVVSIATILTERGFDAYLVGGCVRDMLRGEKPKDWDFTTNATPDDLTKIFPKTFYENEYGTVGIVNETVEDETLKIVEITPYRLESSYSNKRHPDSVVFSKSLTEDLKRRDFTINAIALRVVGEKNGPPLNEIVDPFDGRGDLERKLIRAVGNAQERFSEDALRMLRAIRLATEIDFVIEKETAEAIANHATLLRDISAERIRDEFTKIMMSKNPLNGLILSHKLGVLKFIIPDLEEALGVTQNKAHAFDVFEHLLRTVQHAADKNWPLRVRLAALFHDIGKPASRRWSEEKKDWTFYGHDLIGSRKTKKIMEGLKFSKELTDSVVKLVRWHMFFSDTELITLSSVRRMIKNVGPDLIWDLMNVRACDRIGTGRPKESPYRLRKYKAMIEEVMHDPITVGMLKINGGKVMEITKLQPGPKIGHILHALLEEVLEDPTKNTSEYLEKRTLYLANLEENELKKLGQEAKEKKEQKEGEALKEIRDKYWVK